MAQQTGHWAKRGLHVSGLVVLLFEGELRATKTNQELQNFRHTSPALFYTFFIVFVNYMWCYIYM
ncbi:uncharacterized protein METZ01_LOCUS514787 [marine metagenome]|uniref:Uncharacterized protein n=1 Tax=marine metagenome TaxID=408172 RepID=A0A383EZR9_9ZZZZ